MVLMVLHPVVARMPADFCVFMAMMIPVVFLPHSGNVVLPMLSVFFYVNSVVLRDRPTLFQKNCQIFVMLLMGIIERCVIVLVFGVYVPPGLHQAFGDLVVVAKDSAVERCFPTIVSMFEHPLPVVPYTGGFMDVERCESNIV